MKFSEPTPPGDADKADSEHMKMLIEQLKKNQKQQEKIVVQNKMLIKDIVAGNLISKILIKTMSDAVRNSKILSTFLSSITKALGLLIDLILLPFLPLLVWAIVSLYKAILTLTGHGGDKTGITGNEGIDAANKFVRDFTNGLLNAPQLLELGGFIVVAIAAALLGATAGWAIVAGIITAGIIGILTPFFANLGGEVGKWITKMWADLDKIIYDFINSSTVPLATKLGDAFNLMKDFIDGFSRYLQLLTNPFGTIMSQFLTFFAFKWLGNLFNNPFKFIEDAALDFLQGGWVKALLGGTGGTTNNSMNTQMTFNGITIPDLGKMIDTHLRNVGAKFFT